MNLIQESVSQSQLSEQSWEQFHFILNNEQIRHLLKNMESGIFLDSSNDAKRGHYDILSGFPLNIYDESYSHSPTVIGLDSLCKYSQKIPFQYQPLPFVCGLVGFFSYDYGVQKIVDQNQAFKSFDLPLARCGYYTWSYVYNRHSAQGLLTFSPQCDLNIRKRVISLIEDSEINPTLTQLAYPKWVKNTPYQAYLKHYKAAQSYISEGDCYQINLSQSMEADFKGDPLDLYFHLRKNLNTPYSVYMSFSETSNLLSFSPEQFIGIEDRRIKTRPVKGTVENNAGIDSAFHLLNSAKNRAENLMIVDLMRNDLSKVCKLNSIKVSELFKLESFQNVHHLVSTVEGELKPEISELDAFLSCFPGGSITGAPKIRAMEIINELEEGGRGAYCGSVFYLNDNGKFDSNILIRSIVHSKNKLYCWGGGAIVHDSTPEEEYRESLTKVANLTGILE